MEWKLCCLFVSALIWFCHSPARPHDFFDAQTMDAIRHRAICLNLATHIESVGNGHSVVFHSTVSLCAEHFLVSHWLPVSIWVVKHYLFCLLPLSCLWLIKIKHAKVESMNVFRRLIANCFINQSMQYIRFTVPVIHCSRILHYINTAKNKWFFFCVCAYFVF